MLHVKKDDQVRVLAGKDQGKTGRVLRVLPKRNRAIVENINTIRRHTRANPQRNVQGGVVEREAPIHLSNLKVICPECNDAVRVGYQSLSDGKKVRICKKCSGTIDK
ncbi:MAG: 50S ribosomal protein L24 [Acidobacteriota bacterium]|nr:MAG: 50S ribosomal protein L24 [Acidobacteriota bacterium]